MALSYADKEKMVLSATSMFLLESSLQTRTSSTSSCGVVEVTEADGGVKTPQKCNARDDVDDNNEVGVSAASPMSTVSTASSASSSPDTTAKRQQTQPEFVSLIPALSCCRGVDDDIDSEKEIEWEADLLAGGYTNAAYKVTARNKRTDQTVVSVFAKLAFRNSTTPTDNELSDDVWNHQRTDCEYAAMKYITRHLPAMPIPIPLACINVERNSKLLITSWSNTIRA